MVDVMITASDDILEFREEGFYLVATVSALSDDIDEMRSSPLRNGVALLIIEDNDSKQSNNQTSFSEKGYSYPPKIFLIIKFHEGV